MMIEIQKRFKIFICNW